ncbi:MAG: DEAD/DEAH box helicase [Blastopirellula sp.]|nr:MAG: DEAD/DEAH box helicase [Blastopirellula sp.]
MRKKSPAPRVRTGRNAPKPRPQSQPKAKPQSQQKAKHQSQPVKSQKPSEPTVSDSGHNAFHDLLPEIQKAVADKGYTTPTPIQQQCIEHQLKGKDLIGCAQTGTGKTAAFTLPLLQRLAENSRRPARGTPRALILAPTRELAAQIGESIETYSRNLRISHTVIFGGVNQFHQVKALNKGVDILVATPGRLLDLMQQKHINLKQVEVFILDEVDRMLDMGFIPDIKKVLARIPENRQTLFFSATMAPKMLELALTMVKNPVQITITPDKPAVERIEQKVLFVRKKNKDALLVSLLADSQIKKVIIFTQMKHAANKVVEKLSNAGIHGAAIHGNKSQSARTKALDGFKRGRIKVLVATDVAARGIDVNDVTHVINYDLPLDAETYVHRIGRTARAGASGDAISFCCAEEKAYLNAIEKLLGKSVPTELEHEYHCNEAYRSTLAAPKEFGRNRGSWKRGGRSRTRSRGNR